MRRDKRCVFAADDFGQLDYYNIFLRIVKCKFAKIGVDLQPFRLTFAPDAGIIKQKAFQGGKMKKYGCILFDLDGTLTDPALGITNSFMHALEKYGISVTDRSELYKVIGPPLIDSFHDFYGIPKEECMQAVAYYREYYTTKGIFENYVYDGIPECLGRLKASGRVIMTATSKPEPFAVQIIEHFGLGRYFDCVAGASLDETRTDKDDVIRYALSSNGITDLSSVLMVGDRKYDIIGAKKTGLDSMVTAPKTR